MECVWCMSSTAFLDSVVPGGVVPVKVWDDWVGCDVAGFGGPVPGWRSSLGGQGGVTVTGCGCHGGR